MRSIILLWLIYLISSPSVASENVTGSFTAVRACEAYQSFRKGTNPGLVDITPGSIYEAVEVNAPDWNWIRIVIPEPTLSENFRWVSKECGVANISIDDSRRTEEDRVCSEANQFDSYVLALTWQPGFCEHFPYSGTKPECDALERGDLVITHLTLHGLWPNKKECGTGYGNCGGDQLSLEEDTITELAPWMPNFYFSTAFGEYEWRKHGTCQSLDDDSYYLLALNILKLTNQSSIGKFIKNHIGNSFSIEDFNTSVSEEFDSDVLKRIELRCADNKYINEIRLSLPKVISQSHSLEEMLREAPAIRSSTNCPLQIFVEKSGA